MYRLFYFILSYLQEEVDVKNLNYINNNNNNSLFIAQEKKKYNKKYMGTIQQIN